MKKRNGALCFWAFVFSMIFILHYVYFFDVKKWDSGNFLFSRGEIAIDFFFIAVGAWFAKSINEISADRPFEWRDYGSFLKGVLRRYLPAFAISWVASFIVLNIACFVNVKTTVNNFLTSLLELLPFRSAGFNAAPVDDKTIVGYRVMDQVWIFSAIFIALAILYPLYRRNRQRFEYYIAPVGAVLVLCFLFFRTKVLTADTLLLLDPKPKALYYSFLGTYKAFAEILAGVVCYLIARHIGKKTISKAKSHLLSLIEICAYLTAILYMQFMFRFELPKNFDYLALAMMLLGVTLSLSEKSSISRLCNNKVCYFLGKFSLYPLLTFMMFAKTLRWYLPKMSYGKLTLLYIALTLASAIVVMLLEKPFVRLIKSMKRLFVKPQALKEKETA